MVLPKMILIFRAIPIKIPAFFIELEKNLKIYMEAEGNQKNQTNTEKKSKVKGFTILDLKANYKII